MASVSEEPTSLLSSADDQKLTEVDENYLKFTKGKQSGDIGLVREAMTWFQDRLLSYLATEEKTPQSTPDDDSDTFELRVRLLLAAADATMWVLINKDASSSSSSSSSAAPANSLDWLVAFG